MIHVEVVDVQSRVLATTTRQRDRIPAFGVDAQGHATVIRIQADTMMDTVE